MITDEDIENVREGYRLINERKVKSDYLADDFLLEQAPGIPGTRGTFRGAAGMQASMDELLDGLDAFRFDPQDFQIHDDWLVVPVKFTASARGIETENDLTHIWQLRDHKAVRMRVLAGKADPLDEIRKLS